VVNLLEEGIDVGIRISKLDDSTLVAQQLGSLRRVVVASPDYLRRHGTPQHPRELLKANCLRFVATGATASGWTFYEKGKPFVVPVSGNLDFNQAAPTLQACVAGVGFGMFLSYQPASYIKEKRLKIVLEKFEPPLRPISVVYPHARLLATRTRVFIEWMKQELRDFK
jgi:DNA-binding transcriptional LysR family regulator